MKKKKSLAVFVTDEGFLVPSLVAVEQLQSFGITDIADIAIFLVDVCPEIYSKLNRDFQSEPIKIFNLENKSFIPSDGIAFRECHVPNTTLARLVVGELIDESYDNIIYIDGDVQIVGDPRALFEAVVPYGHILAGRGSIWIEEFEGRETWENLSHLGLKADSYFNAGVLAVSRDTWKEMAPKALNFFMENASLCKTHDQTALNVIFKDRVLEISPVYNFHHMYSEALVHYKVAPKIIHFTGPWKPWSSNGRPWYGEFANSYSSMVKRFDYLSGTIKISPSEEGSSFRAYLRRLADELFLSRNLRKRRSLVAQYIENGNFVVR